MTKKLGAQALLGSTVSALALLLATPAAAQTIPEPQPETGAEPQAGDIEGGQGGDSSGGAQSGTTQSADASGAGSPIDEIIVTAQRQAESLQDVPISVSAFTAEGLERQQIENTSDLQLTLPNITYTKTNFTGSSFTIRGVGDLCTGFTCDAATGVHVNDMPLLAGRLFETEFFDLERVEVLRGPQGTLFGRNATSGVINFITARPNLNDFEGSIQAEYGNFDSKKITGMLNLPLGDVLGVRLAGYYLNREGFTRNLFDDSRIDGRDLYALRGTIRFQPSDSTTFDIIGFYFKENDDRSRIQKQLCNRDETAILGCAPDSLQFETVNGNATLAAIVTSREFNSIALSPAFAPLGLTSLSTPSIDPFFGGVVNPTDLRTVSIDFNPTYRAENYFIMGRLEQDLGESFSLTVTGGYSHDEVDSRTDYNLAASRTLSGNPGLFGLAAFAGNPGFGANNPFIAVRNALTPQGPTGPVCVSEANRLYSGIYGGQVNRCATNGTDYDRSRSSQRQYSIEGHIDSRFDGPFNFLLGGIYVDAKTEGDYFVNSTGLDYASGVIGAATTIGRRTAGDAGFPSVYNASPFFNSETPVFTLRSYGIFGEAYFAPSDKLKFTAGLRYSNDRKFVRARNQLLTSGFLAPFGVADANSSPFLSNVDFDASRAGAQLFAEDTAKFDEFTGRFVVDLNLTEDNLLYASYSRGYKSGGVNPPIPPEFQVQRLFAPEIINAFEVGSKNTFADGKVRLNGSIFYYDYKDLQLSRIVNRTSVNDNTDATIYGAELEAVLAPTRNLLVNLSASYLKTKIKDLQLVDPRDVSGGRSDTVIIKDLTNASNCAVIPTTAGNVVGTNTLVTAFNSALGLRGPTPVPGTNTTGAFSICNALAGTIANPSAPLRALFATPTGALPFTVSSGAAVDLSGNELPQAPEFKFSAGIQYTIEFGGGFSLVPRFDLAYTGEYFGRSFNRPIDRIRGYEILNAQVQLNAPDDRFFVRGFVQNLTNNDAVTGLYVTDQSSGLFTNIFTLDPRRYGIAVGAKF